MAVSQSSYRGCLLGLAVGDAMGYTVDNRSWQEIQEDYGPNGLLGYDLVNGYADVTSSVSATNFSGRAWTATASTATSARASGKRPCSAIGTASWPC